MKTHENVNPAQQPCRTCDVYQWLPEGTGFCARLDMPVGATWVGCTKWQRRKNG